MPLLFALLCASRVIITEVMSNPAGATGAHYPEDRNEFVELFNATGEAVDLLDWTLDDLDGSIDRLVAWQDSSILAANPTAIINYTWLRPGCYAVVVDSEYTDPNPLGGYVQPYRFGDSCLILTTRNTTLGNGLATNDPLILASPYGDTATFGTPFDTLDGFPDNPGDGFSWERIRNDRPDTVTNWVVCPDSSGCTPGRPSAASSVPDLAVTDLALVQPESLKPGRDFSCRVGLANVGYVETSDWSLAVFLDRNSNRRPDPAEETRRETGWRLEPAADTTLAFRFTCPAVPVDLWALLDCPVDRDTANNQLRLTLDPSGANRLLSLATPSFSPDGDGFEDSLEVVYWLPRSGGKLRIAVFDLGGRPARTLLETRAEAAQGVTFWDGRLDSGGPASRGVYAVWLSYHLPDFDRVEKLPVLLERWRK